MTEPTFLAFRKLLPFAILAAGACGPGSPTPATTPAPEAEYSRSDLEAIEAARVDSARYPYTTADIHFMSGMIGHHAQAIRMAELAETRDASPSIRILAGRIINAQHDEITVMRQWLRDRRQPIPEVSPMGVRMVMNGMEHDMAMPGMVTPEQFARLEKARGLEFDRLFLTLMIQHHRGATEMVKTLFSTDGAAQNDRVFKLASDVNVDQITEIARMERMLAALPPASRAP